MEWCEGDPNNDSNPFQFVQCWLNLPTAWNYEPSIPRVTLLHSNREMASHKVNFVHDIHRLSRRISAQDQCVKDPLWVLAYRMNHKGNQ